MRLTGSNLRDAILDAMERQELMTIAELCEVTGSTYGAVWGHLYTLRKAMVVDATISRCRPGAHGYMVKGWFILRDES